MSIILFAGKINSPPVHWSTQMFTTTFIAKFSTVPGYRQFADEGRIADVLPIRRIPIRRIPCQGDTAILGLGLEG